MIDRLRRTPRGAILAGSARLLLAFVAVIGVGGCTSDLDTCEQAKLVDLPLRMTRSFLLAPARLDGIPATFLVDTGAEITTITPESVRTLGLDRVRHMPALLQGVGATVVGEAVTVPDIRLGGSPQDGLAIGALTVDISPLSTFPSVVPPVVGLLGADVLGRYDVLLDMNLRQLALYAPSGCATPRTGLPGGTTTEIPFVRTRRNLAVVAMRVDGQVMRALLDTGARTSLLSLQAAARLGVAAGALADDPVMSGRGIGMRSFVMRRHRFAAVELGGFVARDMVLNVAPLQLPGLDMLLGADWLAGHRLFISYATQRLYLR